MPKWRNGQQQTWILQQESIGDRPSTHAVVVLYSAELTKHPHQHILWHSGRWVSIYTARYADDEMTISSMSCLLPGQVVNQQKKGDEWCDEGSHPPAWFGLKYLHTWIISEGHNRPTNLIVSLVAYHLEFVHGPRQKTPWSIHIVPLNLSTWVG